MNQNPIPKELQSEHLFLLMGTNPLPDWVATRLLLRESGQLYLVYSDTVFPMAQRLAKYLMDKHQYRQPIYVRVENEYKATDVYNAIKNKLKNIPHGIIGLNYTGGTKVMATHSHRATEKEHPVGVPPIVFSYLEAATCTMRFDSGEEYIVGLAEKAKLSLLELFKLHEEFSVASPTKKVQAEAVFNLLAKAHTDFNKQLAWRKFCENNLKYPRGKPTNKPNKRPGDILVDTDARLVKLNLGNLFADIANALTPNGSAGTKTLGDVVDEGVFGFKTAEALAEWLDGMWLEHYFLKQIAERQADYKVHDFGRNIEPRLNNSRRDKFEADVAAMRGYQLHLISCYSGNDKKTCKMKLFEVFTRARQLGGDESRAALVCCSDDPRLVELEVGQIWDMKNRVKVFGRNDLLKLGDRLKDWFDSGAKEK